MNILNAGHAELHGRQGAGLSMVWQRALVDEARVHDKRGWNLAWLSFALFVCLVLLLNREPFAFKLPAAW